MRTELSRIGVNYNQEVKLKNLERKYAEGKISVLELANTQQSIVEECKGFSPEVINEIMNRFDAIAEEFVNVMAYTRISHTRNGRAAIQYARGNSLLRPVPHLHTALCHNTCSNCHQRHAV